MLVGQPIATGFTAETVAGSSPISNSSCTSPASRSPRRPCRHRRPTAGAQQSSAWGHHGTVRIWNQPHAMICEVADETISTTCCWDGACPSQIARTGSGTPTSTAILSRCARPRPERTCEFTPGDDPTTAQSSTGSGRGRCRLMGVARLHDSRHPPPRLRGRGGPGQVRHLGRPAVACPSSGSAPGMYNGTGRKPAHRLLDEWRNCSATPYRSVRTLGFSGTPSPCAAGRIAHRPAAISISPSVRCMTGTRAVRPRTASQCGVCSGPWAPPNRRKS